MGNNIRQEFIEKAGKEGLEVKEIKEEMENISNSIKTEIAGVYWGKREEMVVSLNTDSQLQSALEYLSEANNILNLYKKSFKD